MFQNSCFVWTICKCKLQFLNFHLQTRTDHKSKCLIKFNVQQHHHLIPIICFRASISNTSYQLQYWLFIAITPIFPKCIWLKFQSKDFCSPNMQCPKMFCNYKLPQTITLHNDKINFIFLTNIPLPKYIWF